MNILDIGIDIVEIGRIKNALDSNGNFLKKLFTDKEIELFRSKGYAPQTIAGNFVDIEILRDKLGKPIVKTHNNLEKICESYNVLEIKVSISHGKDYAIANAMTIIKDN